MMTILCRIRKDLATGFFNLDSVVLQPDGVLGTPECSGFGSQGSAIMWLKSYIENMTNCDLTFEFSFFLNSKPHVDEDLDIEFQLGGNMFNTPPCITYKFIPRLSVPADADLMKLMHDICPG